MRFVNWYIENWPGLFLLGICLLGVGYVILYIEITYNLIHELSVVIGIIGCIIGIISIIGVPIGMISDWRRHNEHI